MAFKYIVVDTIPNIHRTHSGNLGDRLLKKSQMTLCLASIVRGFTRCATVVTRPYLAAQSFLATPPPAEENGQGRHQFCKQLYNQFHNGGLSSIVACVSAGLLVLGHYKDDNFALCVPPNKPIDKISAAAAKCYGTTWGGGLGRGRLQSSTQTIHLIAHFHL